MLHGETGPRAYLCFETARQRDGKSCGNQVARTWLQRDTFRRPQVHASRACSFVGGQGQVVVIGKSLDLDAGHSVAFCCGTSIWASRSISFCATSSLLIDGQSSTPVAETR